MPTVSILIPAYNASKYLSTALDSVLKQTMSDWEAIVVDDGSTDETVSILKDYAARDSRVRVIFNETNRGIMYSRWRGLQEATGNYIMFLDSDDLLVPNACEVLCEEMERGKWDVLLFGTSLVDAEYLSEEEYTATKNYLSVPAGPFPRGKGAMLSILLNRQIPWSVWNKVYTRDVLQRALRFYQGERVQMAEDILLVTMVLAEASSFGTTPQAFYNYRMGSGVSTVKKVSGQRVESFALLPRVYLLLKDWLPQTDISAYLGKKVLTFIKKHVQNEVAYTFFFRIAPKDYRAFVSYLLEYWNAEEFIQGITEAVFQNKMVLPEDAAKCLKDCFPTKTTPIRTVAMFYNRFYNGGVERVMAQLSEILVNSGYNVVLITVSGPTKEDYALPEGVKHIALFNAGFSDNNRTEEWQNVIRAYGIDAVIYHAWQAEDLILDSMAIKSMQIPLILHSHGLFSISLRSLPYTKMHWFRQKDIYALFDVVVTLSEADEAWCRALGFRTVQVSNPLTYALEDYPAPDRKGNSALWVGRLSGEKQYYDAFEIAREVRKRIPDFTLRIVGRAETPELTAEIMDYVNEQQMSEYVLFDGFHSDVKPYYLKADLLLFTSALEGFGLVLQEAKDFSLPIVSYELPNLTLLRQEDSGVFVVPQRDIAAAADCIEKLLKDDELRLEAGRKARASLEDLYSRDLGEVWSNILETAAQPREETRMLYQQQPIYTAVCMAVENAETGMELVMQQNGYARAQTLEYELIQLRSSLARAAESEERFDAYLEEIAAYRRRVDELEEEKEELRVRCGALENTANEIRSSTTYRLGRFLLWPLLKLKDWLFRRSKS